MPSVRKPAAALLFALLGTLLGALLATTAFSAGAGDDVAVPGGSAAPRAAVEAEAGEDPGARLSRIEQAMWDGDSKAAPILRDWAARDPDDRVRERSVGALALLRDAKAVPVVIGRLREDPSAAVRRAAAEAIGLLGPASDNTLLEERLKADPDPFVRAECARAMGRSGRAAAAPPLMISAVRDPSPEVRAVAAQTLAVLRARDAAPVLQAVAQSDDAVLVRIYAVRSLAAISPVSSLPVFRALWDGSSDPDLRLEAFRGALAAEGGDAWERLGLADADERVRFLAFEAWLARSAAIRARFNAPDPAFAARLEGFLTDRIPGIRDLARERMEALGFRIRPSGFGYAVER